jgi:hypothetical protein
MLGVTIVSTLVVVIYASSDWVIAIPTNYLRISIIATFNTISEGVFIQRQ